MEQEQEITEKINEKGPETEKEFPALKKAEEMLKALEQKEKELTEKEKTLNQMFKEHEQKLAEAKLAGFGEMRKEKSQDEKEEEAAYNLIKGTGLEFKAFPNKKAK